MIEPDKQDLLKTQNLRAFFYILRSFKMQLTIIG